MPAAAPSVDCGRAPAGYVADRDTVISSNDCTAADDHGARQTAKRGQPALAENPASPVGGDVRPNVVATTSNSQGPAIRSRLRRRGTGDGRSSRRQKL